MKNIRNYLELIQSDDAHYIKIENHLRLLLSLSLMLPCNSLTTITTAENSLEGSIQILLQNTTEK